LASAKLLALVDDLAKRADRHDAVIADIDIEAPTPPSCR
jgi:hypothetical protein